MSLRIETKTKGINSFHCTEKVVSTLDCLKQMAFVPYVPSVHYIPTSSNSSCRNIISSTSSTYVYSRPLSASHLENVTLCAEQQRLNVSDGVNPGVQPQDQQTKEGHHKRTHFTVLQRRELEKIFSESQYLTPQKRESISQQLGITEEVIQTWFKNRRVKWRKEQRRRQSVAVSTPPSLSTGLYFHYFGHVPYPSSKLMLKDARMLCGSAASSQD